MQPPQIGDMMLYRLTEADAYEIGRRRSAAADNLIAMIGTQNGLKVFDGLPARAGDLYPMLVVSVGGPPGSRPALDTPVCGRVFLNGNDDLQVFNIGRGYEPGTWRERS